MNVDSDVSRGDYRNFLGSALRASKTAVDRSDSVDCFAAFNGNLNPPLAAHRFSDVGRSADCLLQPPLVFVKGS